MSALASERYSDRIATGSLVLVQEVLNTRAAGKPALEDLLSTPEAATSWLSIALGEWGRRSGSEAPAIEVDEPGLVRLQQLRASLQMAVAGEVRDAPVRPAPKGVSGTLDVRIDAEGALSLAPRGKDASWVVAASLNEIANAQLLGTWRRLKMCRNWNCSVAFYDGTNNNNGVWHDVRICGNAVNLRASRQRRAVAGA
ncbi:CGNR zinc finger domain-containing protein [Streptomyces bobili]|uniref:CGNR zinc finger domain-containing protein n=1 Tax=Streptomyces bobili TaxID=67280 RepID=UPI0037A51F2C